MSVCVYVWQEKEHKKYEDGGNQLCFVSVYIELQGKNRVDGVDQLYFGECMCMKIDRNEKKKKGGTEQHYFSEGMFMTQEQRQEQRIVFMNYNFICVYDVYDQTKQNRKRNWDGGNQLYFGKCICMIKIDKKEFCFNQLYFGKCM